MIEIGQPAPAFSLPDQDGNPVRLQDLAGRWVVLYFYPRDDTPGCTVEACEFTAGIADFRGLSATVYGCSADSPQSHRRFIDKHRLGVQLLSDADKQTMRAYGAYGSKVLYGKKTEGVIRSTVVIAPDGRVARHWPNVKAKGHADAVRQALRELQGEGAAEMGAGTGPRPAKAAVKPARKAKAATKAATKPASKPAMAAASRKGAPAGKAKATARTAATKAGKTGKAGNAAKTAKTAKTGKRGGGPGAARRR